MFDHIQQHDDIKHPKLRESGVVSNPVCDRKTASPAKCDRGVRDFNSGCIIKAARLLQKETIGASDFQKASAAAKATNELYRALKFAPQDRLAASIVGVTVAASPCEIIFRVIAANVETAGFGAA